MPFLLIILGILLVQPTALAGEVLLDRLVAEVNSEAVTYSEVAEKVAKGPLVEVTPFPAKENDPPFEVALQDLINLKLILQKAKELEIEVPDEQLDSDIEKFLEKKNSTKKDLLEAIAQQGMTYEQYREDFRKQSILSQFQGRVILPLVKVADKDLELYYLRHSGGSQASQFKIVLRQIFIKYPTEATESVKTAKVQLADRIYKELAGGMVFAEAAKIYSDNSGAEAGGLMPAIFIKDLSQEIKDQVESLQEKEFTKPIPPAGGIYIFYLEQRMLADNDDFVKKKNQLEFQMRQEEVIKQTMKWLEEQRSKSKIRIIGDVAEKK